jgi:hypothetical protein
VSVLYANVRLSILNGILHTTPRGYRANDARLLIGWIQWRLENVDAAISAWCDVTSEPADEYIELAASLRAILRMPVGADVCTTRTMGVPEMSAVEKWLQRERGRLWEFQYRRISEFGYSLSSF